MGALVTVMVSPKLADGCAVAKDAVAALVADGWTPPERLPGFESGEHPAAEADHGKHEANQDRPADVNGGRPAGVDSQESDRDTDKRNQQASSDKSRARTVGLGFPHVIHGLSIAQEVARD